MDSNHRTQMRTDFLCSYRSGKYSFKDRLFIIITNDLITQNIIFDLKFKDFLRIFKGNIK